MAAVTEFPIDADRALHANAERLADVLLAIETVPACQFRMTATAVGTIPVIYTRAANRTWSLSPGEVRTLARCLTWEGRGRYVGLLASLLEGLACDAEALACPVASARRQQLETIGAA
jgi:hypothetical protein